MLFCRMLLLATALFVCTSAVGSESADSQSSDARTRGMLTITVTSERNDGSRTVDTRVFDMASAIASGLIGMPGAATEATGPQPPVQPNPPLSGSVPNDTTRISIHQENDYFERDTTFTRAPGGPWFISNDTVKSTRPAKCYTHPPECDLLPQ
jgi:hypothetical protein